MSAINQMTKYHSEILDLDYATNPNTGNVHFNDISDLTGKQVIYTPDEMAILHETGGEVTPALHLVKKLFGGEILRPAERKNFKDKYKEVGIW